MGQKIIDRRAAMHLLTDRAVDPLSEFWVLLKGLVDGRGVVYGGECHGTVCLKNVKDTDRPRCLSGCVGGREDSTRGRISSSAHWGHDDGPMMMRLHCQQAEKDESTS